MKYNQVRIGDGVIVKERTIVIHSLGTLDWDIYDCISSNHIADEVIITEEQMMHIRERHPEAYIDAMHLFGNWTRYCGLQCCCMVAA